MLVNLSIRDVVLIDKLDLSFHGGLCVLTGETGAGKSILLDALGLALGSRADSGLLRPGSRQATVTAAFDITETTELDGLLTEHGLAAEDGLLVLRRNLGADGRSRAFVNDQPVSVSLLRRLGEGLVEVHGHFEQRGLLDSGTHRDLLDASGGLEPAASEVVAAWEAWREAAEQQRQEEEELQQARQDEDFLRHAVAELETLDAQPGEEAALAEERAFLQHGEQLTGAVDQAFVELNGKDGQAGAETAVGSALSALERVVDKAGGRLDEVIAGLHRTAAELRDVTAGLQSLSSNLELDPQRLEQVDERFFALKDVARKHGVEVDELLALREDLAGKLASIDTGAERLAELAAATAAAREAYLAAAKSLSRQRADSAAGLDRAVMEELPPLKLDKAAFTTRLEHLDETAWGPNGLERVVFEVATNPGSRPGPIGKIASAGELSRFLLALKVVLARVSPRRSLIFDEVDSGIGGATAAAVGQRLARLAADRQVLVVTHSPQVAAVGNHHLRVRKDSQGEVVATEVAELAAQDRREEIARMLSGEQVTEEARAAADRLMGAA